MTVRRKRRNSLVVIMLLSAAAGSTAPIALAQTTAETRLASQSNQFRREIVRVTQGVYVAVGYGMANSVLIEGDSGVIIVDTMEGDAAARDVKAAFDRITTKPVVAIIYTHNHRDHTLGSDIFAANSQPAVYANVRFTSEELANSPVRAAIGIRSRRQFGAGLPAQDRPNLGIGPQLRIDPDGFLPPTITFDEELSTVIAGVKVRLVHAPGETADQIYVMLPDKRVLLSGDNYYHAFPNLYAVRGTRYRDVREWSASLTKMIGENAEHLVPGHTSPVSGEREVRERLTTYRDAVSFVYQATIDGINDGKTPNQIAHEVQLPETLAAAPYLQEFYGTVPWAVRAIYAGELGWFSGNATDLFPLSDQEHARRVIDLAGGTAPVLANVQRALESADYQWAAELADYVLAVEPSHQDARIMKARALDALGREQVSANSRNYFLSSALELRRPQSQ